MTFILHTHDMHRENAGNLLRLISNDFNSRKFPELVAPFKARSQSVPATERRGRWRAATNAFVFLRRLSRGTFGSGQPTNEEGQQSSSPSGEYFIHT